MVFGGERTGTATPGPGPGWKLDYLFTNTAHLDNGCVAEPIPASGGVALSDHHPLVSSLKFTA